MAIEPTQVIVVTRIQIKIIFADAITLGPDAYRRILFSRPPNGHQTIDLLIEDEGEIQAEVNDLGDEPTELYICNTATGVGILDSGGNPTATIRLEIPYN